MVFMTLTIFFLMLLSIGVLTIGVLNEKRVTSSRTRRLTETKREREDRKQDQQARTLVAREAVDEDEGIPRVSESTLRVPPPDVRKIEAVAPRNDGLF